MPVSKKEFEQFRRAHPSADAVARCVDSYDDITGIEFTVGDVRFFVDVEDIRSSMPKAWCLKGHGRYVLSPTYCPKLRRDLPWVCLGDGLPGHCDYEWERNLPRHLKTLEMLYRFFEALFHGRVPSW